MGIRSKNLKRFKWSMKLLRRFIDKRRNAEYDINIIITGKRGKGKSTFSKTLLFGFEDFNPDKEICYTREKLNEVLMTKGGYCDADEGVVTLSRGNTTTKGNKELYEILTKNRDNMKVNTWLIPNIENVDLNILQYCCMWIHIDKRGVGAVFMPMNTGIFSKDSWQIDKLKKDYVSYDGKGKASQKFPYWKFPNFRGWIMFGKLPKYKQDIVDRIKERDKNASMKPVEKIEIKSETLEPKKIKVPERKKMDYADLTMKIINKDIVSVKQFEDLVINSEVEGVIIDNVRKNVNGRLKSLTGQTISNFLY